MDAGAVEVPEVPGLIVTTAADIVDATDGEISLREAIAAVNNGVFAAGSTITFASAIKRCARGEPRRRRRREGLPGTLTLKRLRARKRGRRWRQGASGVADRYYLSTLFGGVTRR